MKKALWFVSLVIVAAGLVQGGTLKLVAPSGGELCLGAGVKIQWTAVNVRSKVKLQLLRPDGTLVGKIAGGLDAALGHYNWTVGVPALEGKSYRVQVAISDETVKSMSAAPFLVKKCPPPPSNVPQVKSQVELMQQPPTLTQPQVTPAPNTVVISQLPQAAISKFSPDKTAVISGEKISITIVAANVTKAVMFDDAGKSLDLTGEISNGAINRMLTALPTRSGVWRLEASNLGSRADAKFDIQVSTLVKPEFVSYTPNLTQFNDGDQVSFTYHVRNAQWIGVYLDREGTPLDTNQAPAGQSESFGVLDFLPGHTVKVYLKAGNAGGETTTPSVLLQCLQDIPQISEFLPERNNILGFPQDKATLKWRVRGADSINFYERDPSTSDIPSNYKLIHSELCAHFCEKQFEHKPPRFPWVYRMETIHYDGYKVIADRTIR